MVELHVALHCSGLIDKCLETAAGEQVLAAALEDNLVAGACSCSTPCIPTI